ncbi:MAG: serine hydrolase domain-containing protein [Leeuwenhoekiella sp.]
MYYRKSLIVATSISLFLFSFSSAGRPEKLNSAFSIKTKKDFEKDSKELKSYTYKKTKIAEALDTYFENAIDDNEIVGAGVSIVNGDSIVFSGGFGKRSILLEDSIDEQTVFRLGSLSKGFAGVLSSMFVDKELLSWDSKVEDYVEGFRLGSFENSSKITLRNIISHTSGSPYHSYSDLVEAGMDLDEIAKRFKRVVPVAEPGELYSYQNAIFALSGTLIEKASGHSFSDLLKEELFSPLTMITPSSDYTSLLANDNIAQPHLTSYNGWRIRKINAKYFNAIAAGGINASALDMAKWMRFLLGHNPEIASRKVLEDVFIPEVEIEGKNNYYQQWPGHLTSKYAHGWRIHEFQNSENDQIEIMMHHGGTVSSYRNEIALFPNEDLGITVLFNSNTKLAKTVIPELHQIIREILIAPVNLDTDVLLAEK